ncbi:DNA helicase, partial [Tanacetum coccineum]
TSVVALPWLDFPGWTSPARLPQLDFPGLNETLFTTTSTDGNLNYDDHMGSTLKGEEWDGVGIMATTSNPDRIAETKGKMIAIEPEVTSIADLRPTDCSKIIEAIVYRKWISKHVFAVTRPVHGNEHWKIQPPLYLKNSLTVKKYQVTVSLNTTSTSLPTMNFQQRLHWTRASGQQNLYIRRCDIKTAPLKAYRHLKSKLALWHEMALNFNLKLYEAMKKPVVLAVISWWVRQFHGLQLSGTSATYYCQNPNILEAYHINQQEDSPAVHSKEGMENLLSSSSNIIVAMKNTLAMLEEDSRVVQSEARDGTI